MVMINLRKILNIAGPRDSEQPGIGDFVQKVLSLATRLRPPTTLRMMKNFKMLRARERTRGLVDGFSRREMNQTTYTRSSLFQPISSIVETAAEEANRKIRRLSRISRVAPSNPNQQKINEDIDDDVLERCTRCPPHRKRKGKFRPLIGNDGEFLCDPCYVAEFPATAFVDENKVPNGQRRASFVEIGGATTSWVRKGARRITGKVRNKASDLWADAMGETEVPNNFEESSKNENGKFPSEIE
jgi:hypothetical protein